MKHRVSTSCWLALAKRTRHTTSALMLGPLGGGATCRNFLGDKNAFFSNFSTNTPSIRTCPPPPLPGSDTVLFSKKFCFLLTARIEVISTDVHMRVAMSWDPCGSGDEIELDAIIENVETESDRSEPDLALTAMGSWRLLGSIPKKQGSLLANGKN